MTADPSAAATEVEPGSGPAAPAVQGSEGSPAPDSPAAVPLHGNEQPPADGGIWTGAARSERPGDHDPAPDDWVNPPARQRFGSEQPPEQGVWTGKAGGAESPHHLSVTEDRAPEGWENPLARERFGSAQPPA